MSSPVYVNTTSGSNASPGSSIATAAAAHTTANVIVVGIYVYNNVGAASISSVTDTAANTYTPRGVYTYGNNILALYVADNITGHASNVVTATLPDVTYAYRHIAALQYSGSPGADTGFTASGVNSASSPIATGSGTVAANDAIVVGLYTPSAGTTFSNSGGTIRADTGGICMTEEVVAAGTRSTSVAFAGGSPTVYATAAAIQGTTAVYDTFRPSGVLSAGTWAPYPSGTLHGVTSDEDDATYAESSTGAGSDTLDLSFPAMAEPPAGTVTFYLRHAAGDDIDDITGSGDFEDPGGTGAGTGTVT